MAQTYKKRVLRALDRLVNAIKGGDDEETISHRDARANARGLWWGKASCWTLDKFKYICFWNKEWWDFWDNHCDDVLDNPNPSDATIPLEAPLKGDANNEAARHRSSSGRAG